MEIRKVPFKNYIILGMISLASFILVYIFVEKYEKQNQYQMETRMGFLSTVKEQEIKNYILDNRDVIIYISDATDDQYKIFEQELKNKILEENLVKEIVYMNMNGVHTSFLKNLQKEIPSNITLETLKYPNVITVTEGTITSVLYPNKQERKVNDIIHYVKEQLDAE